MIIEVVKLRGRPKKYPSFNLMYHEWLSLKQLGMVKVGGYLLKMKIKKKRKKK